MFSLRCVFIGILMLPLAACGGGKLADVGVDPGLSPVGSGLQPDYSRNVAAVAGNTTQRPHRFNSLWSSGGPSLYDDARALVPGDVVTIKITMDDSASLANSTDRSRKASSTLNGGLSFGMGSANTSMNGSANAGGSTSTQGQGTVDRSEKMTVLVAAVVNQVLANGNLIISGSQEVRVNSEMRVVKVAGIIRPRDIDAENTITYDKVAEARISYGGMGRLTEVQQPGYGQQIIDQLSPY